MIIGFTGTQRGMTTLQKVAVAALFAKIRAKYGPGANGLHLHHGDCLGADAEAHALFLAPDPAALVTVHPPNKPDKRAFCQGTTILPELPFLERNKAIVDASEGMIATPGEFHEQLRGGTWSTVRYTKRSGKKLALILPDGTLIWFVGMRPR